MARGKQQYIREAKPMGYMDLDDNEFSNFNFLSKKGKKGFGRGLNKIFARAVGCQKRASTMRFATKEAKTEFMQKCVKEAKDKIKTKTQSSWGKVKDWTKGGLGGKPYQAKPIKREKQRPIDPVPVEDTTKPNTSPTTTTTTNGKGVDVPPASNITPKPIEKQTGKLLLYGAIGVVVLVFGLKLIKN